MSTQSPQKTHSRGGAPLLPLENAAVPSSAFSDGGNLPLSEPAPREQRPLDAESASRLTRLRKHYDGAVLWVSVGFLVLFGGFNGAQCLQSSLDASLGSISLGVMYATAFVSGFFAPPALQFFEGKTNSIRTSCILGGLGYFFGGCLVNMVPPGGAVDWTWALYIFANFCVGLGNPWIWVGQLDICGKSAVLRAWAEADIEFGAGAVAPGAARRHPLPLPPADVDVVDRSSHGTTDSGVEMQDDVSPTASTTASLTELEQGPRLSAGSGAAQLSTTDLVIVARRRELVTRYTTQYNTTFFTWYQASGLIGTTLGSVIMATLGDDSREILFGVLSTLALLGVSIFFKLPRKIQFDDVDLRGTSSRRTDAVRGSRSAPSGSTARELRPTGAPLDSSDEMNSLLRLPTAKETAELAFVDKRLGLFVLSIFANGNCLAFIFAAYGQFIVSPLAGDVYVGVVVAFFYLCNSGSQFFWEMLLNHGVGNWGRMRRRRGFLISTALQVVFFVSLLGVELSGYIEKNANFVFDGGRWRVIVDPTTGRGRECPVGVIVMIFLGAALFGFGDAFYENQQPASLQTLFANDEKATASYACYCNYQNVGYSCMFFLNMTSLSMTFKIGWVLTLLVSGLFFILLLNDRVRSLD